MATATLTEIGTREYRLGEFHSFAGVGEGADRRFLYLVPAGAVFELDGAAEILLGALSGSPATHQILLDRLAASGIVRWSATRRAPGAATFFRPALAHAKNGTR